ncbi:hypothetical protein ABZS83_10585 [Streptomyces sp. NPDC005426]|uniref:hypothetical protein n=1 Tax=Streptomyces sp. NPDC005426 TaxID=3155344 RepID=UPI0033B47E94
METDGVHLTPQQARAALADTRRISASAAELAATPWPTWFFVALTLYVAALPLTYGGIAADSDWLLPRPAWVGVMLTITAVYVALLSVASRVWRNRTGVALRFDVLPKRATLPVVAGLPVLVVGAAVAFRLTGWPGWLIASSLISAGVSVGFHLAFVRLHRKSA